MAEVKKSAAKGVKAAAKKAPAKAAVKKAVAKTVPVKKTAKMAAKAEPSYQQIAELAHKYWQQRGGHHGSDAQDWLHAEKELRGE